MEEFRNIPWIKIAKYMSGIRNRSLQELKDKSNEKGISFHQIHVLSVLSKNSSLNQQDISDRMGFDKSSITRAIKQCIKDGYVNRERDKVDKRAFNVFLTSKGRKKIEETNEILINWSNQAIKGFSPEELDEFINYLKRISQNIGVEQNEY